MIKFDTFNNTFDYESLANDANSLNSLLLDMRKEGLKTVVSNINLERLIISETKYVLDIFEKLNIESGLDISCFLGSIIDPANVLQVKKLSMDIQRCIYNGLGTFILDGSMLSIDNDEIEDFYKSLNNIECFEQSMK